MSKHLTKCKWCQYGTYSYKWGEWNCWHKDNERPLTDAEAKRGCRKNFKPNRDCPLSIIEELGFKKEDAMPFPTADEYCEILEQLNDAFKTKTAS